METKNSDRQSEKLAEEFSGIISGNFWKKYMDSIERYKRTLARKLETDQIDKIPGLQGQIRSLRYVIGLPEEILGLPSEKIEGDE